MVELKVRALIVKDDPQHSSKRSVEGVTKIFEIANEIWRQASVRFDAAVLEWRFAHNSLDGVVQAAFERQGDTEHLSEVTGTAPREITAIYLRSIGGSNGKVFRTKRAIVVVDNTSVSDARTTAHEIGHIFELEHWLEHPPPEPPDRPPNQLMARTQIGTELIPLDIQRVNKTLPFLGLEMG